MNENHIRGMLRLAALASCLVIAAAVCADEPEWQGGPKPCGAAGTIMVIVSDKITGQHLVGARVELIQLGSPMVKYTTSSGTVSFTGLYSNLLYRIQISQDGYDSKHRRATVECGGIVVKRAGLLPSTP